MDHERPDMSQIPIAVREYVEWLEKENARLQSGTRKKQVSVETEDPVQLPDETVPAEPPTTIQVVTITASGLAKRTPRHVYIRQRRGGMGIFDLDAPEDDPPAILVLADLSQHLLLFTSLARTFRLPVNQIIEAPIRGRGASIVSRMNLNPDEHLVAALPDEARGAVVLISAQGMVRHLRHHIFGEYMKPGTVLLDPVKNGLLVSACRTRGDADIFIATQQGKAIRFAEKLIPPQGCLGIRLEKGDAVTGIAGVSEEHGVFLADSLGRGTIRLMSGFTANKSAGGGGKTAMNTDRMVAALNTENTGDIFMISRWSKIIRFSLDDVPAKEGVVQGVNCMMLRADEVTAVALSQ